MAIGVGLVATKPGTRLYFELPPFEAYVPEVDLPVEDERYPYLRLIDPYDVTVLSAHQCRIMEPDFARLAEVEPDPQFAQVLDLVRRCTDFQSVWFFGD